MLSGVVRHLLGAASVSKPGVKPYVFTTSDFHANAHKIAAAGAKQAHLMSGVQLVHYINYIRGSRHDDDDTNSLISPEYFCGRDGPVPSVEGAAKILTVANNKGGVGKTTTAFYLGAELARRGERVLLIDLDSQANLTEYCFPDEGVVNSGGTEHFPSIGQYFAGQESLHNLIKSTSRERLSIIPSDPFLRLRDLGGTGRPELEARFAQEVQKLSVQPIASLGGVPDWIVIDTPPAMSAFTRAGLAAAHYVLAPVRPRRRSLSGTMTMLRTLDTMHALMRGRTKFLGTIITHWDGLRISQNFEDLFLPQALGEFDGHSLKVKIPMDNQLQSLAPGANIAGARAYSALSEEIQNDVQSRGEV